MITLNLCKIAETAYEFYARHHDGIEIIFSLRREKQLLVRIHDIYILQVFKYSESN